MPAVVGRLRRFNEHGIVAASLGMRAMVLHTVGAAFELEERPVKRPRADEALVRVRACGAELTVHHAKVATSPATLQVIMGHEIAGEVVEIGRAALLIQ
jgi:D-arabinose 1-dehydrogenase-like Zn-dependent alcohol dehydrogenase